jgi:hypothetical protein
MGTGKKYSKAQSRILELEAALKQALAIINIQELELKKHRTVLEKETCEEPTSFHTKGFFTSEAGIIAEPTPVE